jgi:hypothetical protein
MIGDLYDVNNVVVGQAAVVFAPEGTPPPAPTDAVLNDPFDLTIWAEFVACGATDQGWKFATNKSTTTIAIEEQSTPVATTISSQAITLEGSLSEDVSATLALAYNATVATTAPGVSAGGYDQLTLEDVPIYYAAALLTNSAEGFVRWIYAPKWTQLSNASTDFRRSSAKRMYPVTFSTVCAPSDIIIINFTADHS